MKMIMIDTNGLNAMVQDTELSHLLDKAESLGLVQRKITNIPLDQTHAMRDRFDLKSSILQIANVISTASTIGFSKDYYREGWHDNNPQSESVITSILGNKLDNRRNRSDAIIAATAKHNDAILFTNDIPLSKKYRDMGGISMNSTELKVYLLKQLQVAS